MKIFVVALSSLFLTIGCSAKKIDESYSYEFVANNCPTGKHTFSSKSEYCDALKNSSLNKGCAESMRKQQFESSGCEGSFRSMMTTPGKPVLTTPNQPKIEDKIPSTPSSSPQAGAGAPSLSEPKTSDQVLVRGKEFAYMQDGFARNILTFIEGLNAKSSVYADDSNSNIRIQKFSKTLVTGVELECLKLSQFGLYGPSKLTCQMLVDLTKSTESVSIELQKTSPKIVVVTIKDPSAIGGKNWTTIQHATKNMCMAVDPEKVALVDEAGQIEKVPRIQFSCPLEAGAPTHCEILGVVNESSI